MWARFKRRFTNKLYKILDEVSDFIKNQVHNLNPEETKKTCRYEYIFNQF
jgi:hypothetical protein